MDFCPRCGRYIKDDEYQCPECGNIVRQIPEVERIPPEINRMYLGKEPVDLKKAIFNRLFFICLIIAFAASFLVTYYWRFTMLFFFIPLFLPMGKISIGAGLFTGLAIGSAVGLAVKYYTLGTLW